MRRGLTAAVLALLLLLGGCRSTLAEGLELARHQAEIHPVVLTELYSDERGYHYPEILYGMSYDEIQEACWQPITKISGYGENGEIFFALGEYRVSLQDAVSTSGAVTVTAEDRCTGVEFLFDQGSLRGDTRLSALYDEVYAELVKLYGEPDTTLKTNENYGNTTATVNACVWQYRTDDGLTRMKLEKTYLTYGTEPDYVSLGFELTGE